MTDGGSFSISADTPTRRGPVEVVDLKALDAAAELLAGIATDADRFASFAVDR